jgi:hypothetical protein
MFVAQRVKAGGGLVSIVGTDTRLKPVRRVFWNSRTVIGTVKAHMAEG